MRRLFDSLWTGFLGDLTFGIVPALLAVVACGSIGAQDFCNPTETVTQEPATLANRTDDNAAWFTGVYDGGAFDLTFVGSGATGRVLLSDPFFNTSLSSFSPTLTRKYASFIPDSSSTISAVAHVPETSDRFYVVNPDFDNPPSPSPRIAIMNTEGSLVQPFRDIEGIVGDNVIAAMDVSPDGMEIALFDAISSSVILLDHESFSVINSFPLLGFPSGLWRGGIAYGSCSTILAVSSFKDIFNSEVALEYELPSGAFTGRAIDLRNIADDFGNVEGVGIDVGFVDGKEVLYAYNGWTDAVYSVELEYSLFPGRVSNFLCSRPEGGGSVSLSWVNNGQFDYDSIAVFQNEVEIATLPEDATSLVLPESSIGYSEFSIETRKDGLPNLIRQYCVNTDSEIPFFTSFVLAGISVGRDVFGSFMGIDSSNVLTDVTEMQLYSVASFDSVMRLIGYVVGANGLQMAISESVTLANPGEFFVQRRGIAAMDVLGTERLMILGLNQGGEFVGAVYNRDGSLFQAINPIDLDSVGGSESVNLTDWDSDLNGDLITYDILANRIVRISYDPEEVSMTAVQSAPAPQCALYDCSDFIAAGALTVLPNGMYLVSSGDSFDSTITRAHLSTPFDSDPDKSVKHVGFSQGLFTVGDFNFQRVLGVGAGPFTAFGLSTTYFEISDPDNGGTKKESVTFYTTPNMPGHPLPFVGSDVTSIANLDAGKSDPELSGEQIVDMSSSGVVFSTPSEGPSFANAVTSLDYYYHIVNRGDAVADVTVEASLGEVVDSDTRETFRIPPERSVYRALVNRAEKAISVRVNQNGTPQEVQVLVGATGIAGETPGPDPDPDPVFIRGDVDSNGAVDVNDPLIVMIFQFLGQNRPTCLDAADIDDSGAVDITDALYSLRFQFEGGLVVPLPGPTSCGPDPTPDKGADNLGCESFAPCDG